MKALAFIALILSAPTLHASTMTSCTGFLVSPTPGTRTQLYNIQDSTSCSFDDPTYPVTKASAQVTESYSLSSGSLHYSALAQTFANNATFIPTPNGFASTSTEAIVRITTQLELDTNGPVRPGFFVFGGSAFNNGVDPGLSWGGLGSIMLGADAFSCPAGIAGQCQLPGPSHLTAVTLGQPITLGVNFLNDSFSQSLFGSGSGLINAGLTLSFFESDGQTAVPITAAVATPEPEPADYILLGLISFGVLVICRWHIYRVSSSGQFVKPRRLISGRDMRIMFWAPNHRPVTSQ
jgi:hypothetical protein